ncbi:SGNH/GDSL hydrolase family protein [Nitrospira moscoviensis]|uniref:SGNH hydrolase-type esterase domain-containing protein n=1 Tax=Nitrospira moscoviensis TaxID=42253 RepID=A0A0K2G773_NITMO|nr:SGNH/GDSL hydrolase family protein [Nitrospira moscoviensis]ALA56785.1 hypothetical protein NITMOv2_0347 [Nitrospira moscoviensis]
MALRERIERTLVWVRDAWSIAGISLLLLIVGHYAVGAALGLRQGSGGSGGSDPRANLPVYDGFPEKHAFWKEQLEARKANHFEPYVHWKKDGFTGTYTNISPDGVRRTVKQQKEAGTTTVYMFGGSALWGDGVPDQETIPSLVQSALGGAYDVYNFGEIGYVSAQELNALLYLLSFGNTPDIVIFYDGVNDGYAGAYSPAIPRDPENLREKYKRERHPPSPVVELFNRTTYKLLGDYLIAKLAGGGGASHAWDEKVAPHIEQNAKAVLDVYEAHIRQVKALAAEYGFKPLFFWQPNLLSLTRTVLPYEQDIINGHSPVMVRSQTAVYEQARRRLSGREREGIVFLGNVFDSVQEPIYIDYVHLGRRGNEIIADEMVKSLRNYEGLPHVVKEHRLSRS